MALLESLQTCERYQKARSWQKPFISPGRFVRNQMSKRANHPAGEVRRVRSFHLPEFTIVNGEIVSEQLASYGYFEADLSEAIVRIVRPGDVALDIGMHLGYYTSLFSLLVGDTGEVHAFEPTPSTRDLAQNNVGKFRNVTVHPVAVWSEACELKFRDYGLKWLAFNSFTRARLDEEPSKPREFMVQTTTLDNVRAKFNRPISFIKIDAESAERAIISGGRQTLQQDQPIVSIELGDFAHDQQSRALVDDLAAIGFAPWELRDGRFQPHQPQKSYEYSNLLFATRQAEKRLQPR